MPPNPPSTPLKSQSSLRPSLLEISPHDLHLSFCPAIQNSDSDGRGRPTPQKLTSSVCFERLRNAVSWARSLARSLDGTFGQQVTTLSSEVRTKECCGKELQFDAGVAGGRESRPFAVLSIPPFLRTRAHAFEIYCSPPHSLRNTESADEDNDDVRLAKITAFARSTFPNRSPPRRDTAWFGERNCQTQSSLNLAGQSFGVAADDDDADEKFALTESEISESQVAIGNLQCESERASEHVLQSSAQPERVALREKQKEGMPVCQCLLH